MGHFLKQKQGGKQVVVKGAGDKLPNLPKSTDKFWEGADKHQKDMSNSPTCQHVFRRKGNELICTNCNIGYYTDGKAYIKNGHIYIGKKLVI